jgi:predicted DNA-binding transcriptional regulator AlpA
MAKPKTKTPALSKATKAATENSETAQPQFGTANVPPANAPLPLERKLISPKELPLMGIYYSINHLRRMWKAKKFPQPVYPSTRRFGWYPQDLEKWITDATTEPPEPAAQKRSTTNTAATRK